MTSDQRVADGSVQIDAPPRIAGARLASRPGLKLLRPYGSSHRRVATSDYQHNGIDYTLDAMGNRVTERATDPGGTLVKNIQRSIDALNRVQQLTGM